MVGPETFLARLQSVAERLFGFGRMPEGGFGLRRLGVEQADAHRAICSGSGATRRQRAQLVQRLGVLAALRQARNLPAGAQPVRFTRLGHGLADGGGRRHHHPGDG